MESYASNGFAPWLQGTSMQWVHLCRHPLENLPFYRELLWLTVLTSGNTWADVLWLLCKWIGWLLRLKFSINPASVHQKLFNICSALSPRIMPFLSSKALKQMLKFQANNSLALSRCFSLNRQTNILLSQYFLRSRLWISQLLLHFLCKQNWCHFNFLQDHQKCFPFLFFPQDFLKKKSLDVATHVGLELDMRIVQMWGKKLLLPGPAVLPVPTQDMMVLPGSAQSTSELPP